MCVRTCMCAFALAVAYRSFCLHALAVQAVLQRLQIDDDQERVSFDQINEGLEYLDTWNAVVRSVLCFFECGGKVGRYLIGTWNAAVRSLVCIVECGGEEAGVLYQAHNCG